MKYKNLKTTLAAGQATVLGAQLLSSYDPASCAQLCDIIDDCNAFNIFVERVPALQVNSKDCPNPLGMATIVCGLVGEEIDDTPKTAGVTWAEFKIVTAASNGES